MCVHETTQLQHALKSQILFYEIGDWPNIRPKRGVKTPEMSRSRTSASSMMQTPKRLGDGSPVRPASYGVLAMAGFLTQTHGSPVRQASCELLAMAGFRDLTLRDDLGLGLISGLRADGPPIQRGSIGHSITLA